MAKKQKGPVSVEVQKPVVKRAPGNPGNLNRGNPHTKKNEYGCTEKEMAFVEFYTMSWSLSEAVRNAGYDCINAGSYGGELLKKPHIKALVEIRRAEFRARTHDIRDRLTASLEEAAFSDYSKYFKIEKQIRKVGGKNVEVDVPVVDVEQILKDGNGKIINQIKIGKFNSVEIKLDDRMQAREMLARHIGYNEMDNLQKKTSAVAVYLPDNGRGDSVIGQLKEGEMRTESDDPNGYGKDMKK